ncbi:MAG: hypothetical protein VB878_01270 [Pirellulaceae bacterium]
MPAETVNITTMTSFPRFIREFEFAGRGQKHVTRLFFSDTMNARVFGSHPGKYTVSLLIREGLDQTNFLTHRIQPSFTVFPGTTNAGGLLKPFWRSTKMPDKFDPYREALIVETVTVWPEEYGHLSSKEKSAIESSLHLDPENCASLEYVRMHTGFCRQITVTEEDFARIA